MTLTSFAMEIVISFIALTLAGFVIDIFSSLLGISGGTVMVPVLRLDFGPSAYTSTTTSLFTMIFTSISGAGKHIQQKTSIPLLEMALDLGGAIISALSVWLGSISPAWATAMSARATVMPSCGLDPFPQLGPPCFPRLSLMGAPLSTCCSRPSSCRKAGDKGGI